MEYKLAWPKSAEVMRKWFSLPGRAMTDNEKAGSDFYVDSHIDTTMFSWSWLESFEQVERAKEVLLSEQVLWSDNVRKILNSMVKEHNHNLTHKVIDNSALAITELHAHWQFQHAKVGYELGDVDDLYGSLGNFALYAAIQKASIYEKDGQNYLRVTEVAIYMRDTYDFIGNQYLGSWGPDGMSLNYLSGAMNSFGQEIIFANGFGNQDFREYRESSGKGGDLLLFSDIVTVDVDESIEVNF